MQGTKIKINLKSRERQKLTGDLPYSDSPSVFFILLSGGTSSKELTERSLYAHPGAAGRDGNHEQKQHSARLLFPHKLGVLVCNYAECWREEVQCCAACEEGV